jgi:hypothetical protein
VRPSPWGLNDGTQWQMTQCVGCESDVADHGNSWWSASSWTTMTIARSVSWAGSVL